MRYKTVCGYIRQRWDCGDTVEVEEKHTGRYGAVGQKRKKKRKATPEEMEKHNQWKRERDVRRLIKWNFKEGDCWMTLTYQRKSYPSYEKIKEDLSKLIRKVREKYKKLGWTLKYISRIGIGSRKGPHVHILVNNEFNEKATSTLLIEKIWRSVPGHGHVDYKHTYGEGGYKELAEYIVKPLEEWEPEEMKRYSCSKNLIRKDPEVEEVRRRSLVDRDGKPRPPKAPKGYYIDRDSVEVGKNPVTGYAYRHYILIKIKKRD